MSKYQYHLKPPPSRLPDDTNLNQDHRVAHEHFGDLPESSRPLYSHPESFGMGLAQGATFGLSDEIQGGLQALWDVLSREDITMDMLGERYKKWRDKARQEYSDAKADNPSPFMGGRQTGGALSGVAISGVPSIRSVSEITPEAVAGMMSSGAQSGAVRGYGESSGDTLGDTAKGALNGAIPPLSLLPERKKSAPVDREFKNRVMQASGNRRR